MNFSSLTINGQGGIAAIVTIGFIAMTLALIINILAKSCKKNIFAISLLLLVTMVDLWALIAFIDFSRPSYEVVLSTVAIVVNYIPYPIHIILGLASVGTAAYSIYKVYKAEKDSINDFSIKEALESLPTGIAFTSSDNNIYLSNNIMHHLCKELTGKDLISGIDIWEELRKLRGSDKCVINEDNPAFMSERGKVWQFSRNFCKWHTGDYMEIKATDITELYKLGESTKQFSETLALRQERTKALTNIIEKSTAEEIAVNMKVGFHDNFGNLLTLTKEALRESPENEDVKVIAGYFAEITDIITDLASEKNQGLSLDQIISFSKKLGCEVVINGDLPADDENNATILLCINEALKNAYCHANADKVVVNLTQTKDEVNVIIHNETKDTQPEITEGGGLTGLRQRVEKSGGRFSIKADGGVTMEITLNKPMTSTPLPTTL